jgi:hypothetical protein
VSSDTVSMPHALGKKLVAGKRGAWLTQEVGLQFGEQLRRWHVASRSARRKCNASWMISVSERRVLWKDVLSKLGG